MSGGLDGIAALESAREYETYSAANPDLTHIIVSSPYARMFVWNTTWSKDGEHNESVNNAKIRSALVMALDKESIAAVYGDIGEALTTFVSNESEWYNSDIPVFKTDKDEALRILNEEDFGL